MTPTELTALTNQLMLAISAYGDARVDVAKANAGRDDEASANVREADAEMRRLVRELSALVPVTEAK